MASETYNFKEIQEKWHKIWAEKEIYKTREDPGKPKFYCLDFFPYPSGSGLSVGHLRNYIPTDVISRMKRMQGYNVLHPMGWDAFGLPAENYAIQQGIHPAITTAKNVANYKRQLNLVECSYDWEREINSTDPQYYKWTQWFFLLLYKRGLAYQATGAQWWCPSCHTILANEQVEQGRCWRCESIVEKKDLKQWYFKITDYAERLLEDLKLIDWPEKIKKMQENWIGKRVGTEVIFKAISYDGKNEYDITIFTTRVDTVFGVTFITLAPEHPLVEKLTEPSRLALVENYVKESRRKSEIDRLSTEKEKTGVFVGSYAINPFNGERVPIYIGDYVLLSYGTGAVMAVPAHDERDFQFAKKYNLPIRQVISPDGSVFTKLEKAYTEYGILINSGQFNGLTSQQAIEQMTKWLEEKGLGRRKVNYKFRDWLISRQRYWGAPIPIIHCEKCGTVPVPEDQLPVKLPDIKDFKPSEDGRSPLAKVTEWVNTTCPKCGQNAKRETDTMDGFACSSWYYLRFVDPKLSTAPFNIDHVAKWLPVDLYVGGAEHAVMHLLYARFWTKVMQDEGLVSFPEPFLKLRNQGMMLAADGQKMSKSKGNVITPDEMVEKYGADTLRAFILFLGAFELDVSWSDEGIRGMFRFVNRVWDLVLQNPGVKNSNKNLQSENAKKLNKIMNKTIKGVTLDIENFNFNTAVAKLMEYYNNLSDLSQDKDLVQSSNWREAIKVLLKLLAPITPFLAEELWQRIGEEGLVHQQSWPCWEESALIETNAIIPVQVNGKIRDQVDVSIDITENEIKNLVLAREKVKKWIEGKEIIKFIYVPKRMVSIVVK